MSLLLLLSYLSVWESENLHAKVCRPVLTLLTKLPLHTLQGFLLNTPFKVPFKPSLLIKK